jgi:iron complex outermembrane recepter protein
MKLKPIAAALAAATGATLITPFAWSQESVAGLEEILVTATRREQNLQEVPVSIVAITGDNLELQGLDSLEDVGNSIPNINIQGGGAGTYGTQFTIRGLPNVGVYLDGVWQVGTSGLLVSDFVDLDRIEVLRGPQGTTYGRDSVGGAIRMWTKQPGDEFGGQITATAGSYSRRDVKASLDLPFTEKLRSKWTGSSLYRDGFIEGLTTGQDYGLLDQDTLRGDVVWEPTDKVSMRFIVNSEELVMNEPRIQDGIYDTAFIPGGPFNNFQVIQNWGVIPAQFYGLAKEGAAKRGVTLNIDPFTPQNFQAGYPGGKVGKWQSRSNATTPSNITREQATVDIRWDFSERMSLEFLTATTRQDQNINVDWENSDYTLVEDILRDKLDLFSEEIQLSGGSDRIKWVAGAYFWDQKGTNRDARYAVNEFRTLPGQERPELLLSDVYNSDRCLALLNPATNPNNLLPCQVVAEAIILPNFSYDTLTRAEQNGWAVFGEVTVSLTDRMDLTIGARQHDQTNKAYDGVLSARAAPLAPEGNLYTSGDPWLGSYPTAPTRVQFDQATYKAALQIQFTDAVMGYVSYSEGFDSGGVSSTQTSVGRVFFPYEPQIIDNTEVGLRSDLADGKVRLNATLFDSKWNNIQNAGVVRDPGTGAELPQLVTTNVGDAHATGLELEVTVLPTESLMLNFNVGVLDTGYDYIAPGTFSLDTRTEFAQAPDETYSIGLQHTASLSNGGSFVSRLDYSYTGQFWRSLPFLRQDWYGVKNGGPVPAGADESGDWGTVNARFVYEPADANYSVSFFGTNLTNEYMLNSGFFHGIWGYDFATVSRPREYGASLTFRF